MFKSGYKFKETHTDIHFVREGHGTPGDAYKVNFTQEEDQGKLFASEDEAERVVMHLMSVFERDDDYRWTPVIMNLETGARRMIISDRWHP